MSIVPWRLSATELAERIRQRQLSCVEATVSVLNRIAETNPRIKALADVMADEALSVARAADAAQDRGQATGPLHGVPISVKINVDVAGHATTDGVLAHKDRIARSDSPLVAHLRAAGAVIIGRSNAPAYSMSWFTSNALHGRTLNPFDAGVTPGGSSGGAAAAVALGMGAIAHGNDYGGSVRYPAWACGVVGLRTSVGRVPSYRASSPDRSPSFQAMATQGLLARTVADTRLALAVMMQGSALDPAWVPAPLELGDTPLRVAVCKRHAAYDVDPTVSAAVAQAARWMADAGCEVEEIDSPPHFEEAAALWRQLAMDDLRRDMRHAVENCGDAGARAAMQGFMHELPALDRDQTLQALTRCYAIARAWALFHEHHPVLLMPNAWQRQFPVRMHHAAGPEFVADILRPCAPQLANALMGLPGLAVPTGMSAGLPVGVQVCTARYREDIALRAGAIIEAAARFSALDLLTLEH